jgi:molybdenum-dependent oxidoreductase-like protein
VPPGPCLLEGRAWSGRAPIERVEVSAYGGTSWFAAELEDDLGSPWAWRRWTAEWRPAEAGSYELCSRAADATGDVQPLEPPWNLGGYANNAVQRIPVSVTDV